MGAVLSRTHIAHDIHGFLLPVFEAISNAVDGIRARFGEDDAPKSGLIKIRFRDANNPAKITVSVADNGIGLTDENYTSFKTPYSGYKLKEKGRGFGRFIGFKVYASVVYLSRHSPLLDSEAIRSFRFDIRQAKEFTFLDKTPEFAGSGLAVEYSQPLTDWHDLVRSLAPTEVMDEIGDHFLPYFLSRWLPKTTIQFDDQPEEDITAHFKALFVKYDSGSLEIEIEGQREKLEYSLARLPRRPSLKNHCLLFSAAHRIVGAARDLTNKLGEPHFVDEKNNRYIVVAVVSGEALEKRLNDARTSFDLPSKVVEEIVSEVSGAIQVGEKGQIDRIKKGQSTELDEALRENPILKLGLRGRTVDEYVATRPNNWKAEQFVSDLAIERFRATADLSRAIVAALENAENYKSQLKDLAEKVDEGQKEALAEYVIHRKNIIELVQAARRYGDDGKRKPEEAIHDLVFRRFGDNASTNYFEHNLWLVDDALAFLPYISSDRAAHGSGRKKGDKIPDLMFFDDSLVLGDQTGTSITIVEFKKPSRDDYRFGSPADDPVLQVINTLQHLTKAQSVTRSDGSFFPIGNVVQRFAYIIADLTPSMCDVLRMHDFKNDWKSDVFVRYRDTERMFIQAFGYETLVKNAKERNQAFFSFLFNE
jgi:hypothetical protein